MTAQGGTVTTTTTTTTTTGIDATAERAGTAAPAPVREYGQADVPLAFTQALIGWRPWLEPLAEEELTERHIRSLVQPGRAKNEYFRLLARDPEILEARTLADVDIFTNAGPGLPRGERELGATTTSRANGCVFCASVHARFASHHAKEHADDVARILDRGVDAATELDDRWRAIVDAAVAITATPLRLESTHIDALVAAGLDEDAVGDVIHSAAFFNWANRLMLSLGEPYDPDRAAPPA